MDLKEKEKLIRKIVVSIAVLGIIVCVALLFPQIRRIIISFGEQIAGKSLNQDRWNILLLSAVLVYMCIITAFLIIFFSKLEIPQISPEKQKMILKRVEISLICLYSCILIFLAFSSNAIWLDEAYSLSQIQYSWKDLIQLIIIDVHPPFYYLVLKAASLVFGSSIAAMKMVSVFPTILMVVFVSLFLKKEFSDKAAIIFLLLCITSETVTHYSIEIRMYSWALFFVTLMTVSSWSFFKSGKRCWWIIMLLCALGSAYTHNFAAVGAGIVYLFLFFYAVKYKRDKIIFMLLLAVLAIVLYLPWLPSLIGQFTRVSDNFWIKPLTILNIFSFAEIIFSTGNKFVNIFLCLMFGIICISFLITKNKTEKQFFFFGGVCCTVLLALTGIFISIVARPLFIGRYLMPMCGLVWLFFAIECSMINKKRITAFICVILVLIGVMSFSLSVFNEKKENRDFNAFYTHFTERIEKDDAFIFIPVNNTGSLHIVGIMSYLFPDNLYTIYFTVNRTDGIFFKLWGDKYTAYEDNIFQDRPVWIFVMEEKRKNTQNNNNGPQEIKGVLSGSFGWNNYRFRLYSRSLTDTF